MPAAKISANLHKTDLDEFDDANMERLIDEETGFVGESEGWRRSAFVLGATTPCLPLRLVDRTRRGL